MYVGTPKWFSLVSVRLWFRGRGFHFSVFLQVEDISFSHVSMTGKQKRFGFSAHP